MLLHPLFTSCKKDVYSLEKYTNISSPSTPIPDKPNYLTLRGRNLNISDSGKNYIDYYGFSDGNNEINFVCYGTPDERETVIYKDSSVKLLMDTEIQRSEDTLIVPLNSELNGSPIFNYTKTYTRPDAIFEYSITKKSQHFAKLLIGPNDSALDAKTIVAAYNSLVKINGKKYERE